MWAIEFLRKPGPLKGVLLLGIVIAAFAGRDSMAAGDSNIIALTHYEQIFGLDLNDPVVAASDYDHDGIVTLLEAYQRTNPFNFDTDEDGLSDSVDHELDRVLLNFQPQFTEDNLLHGLWQAWLTVFKLGGTWDANVNAWSVAAGEEGRLCLVLDRAGLGDVSSLELQIEFFDGPGRLFVDLVDESEAVIASSADYGNLLEGTGEVVVKAMNIPLSDYPEARGIYLRGQDVFVLSGVLFVNRSGSVVVEDREAEDSDSGSLSGSAGRARPLAEPVVSGSGRAKSGTGLRHKSVSTRTMPQYVQALMADTDFQITRHVLSGGGARQTSAKFILEDTFAQPSAVGFSYGGGIMLHAGYQQADDQSLAITNVSVSPSGFNPFLGEVATLFYVLSTRPRSFGIEIYNTVTLATFTLMNNMPQGPGLGSFVWDGRDINGNPLDAADWTFRILARDYQGRVIINEDAQVTIVPAETMPVILAAGDNPDPFCPATDVANAISYTTAESQNQGLDVTVAIEDALGNPVTSFSAFDQAPGSYSFNWDGANAGSGLYVYRINAQRSQGGQPANERTGSIILGCGQDSASSPDGAVQVLYQADAVTLSILPADSGQLSDASYALLNQPGLLFQSGVYDIQATPSTGFDPPLILTFQYDSAISGALGSQLELRRYDEATASWVAVANQFIDYANNQIIAEVTSLSLFALFAVEQPSAPAVLRASVRIKPEVLKVNPGILTAFVSLPAGYAASGISAAACEGAVAESMGLSTDGTEMVIKFRRRAIEEALTEQGEALDTHFVVEGTWQGPEGVIPFVGTDDITRIVN